MSSEQNRKQSSIPVGADQTRTAVRDGSEPEPGSAHMLCFEMLSQLAGDVYLYLLGEITRDQLAETQARAIAALKPTVEITPKSEQP